MNKDAYSTSMFLRKLERLREVHQKWTLGKYICVREQCLHHDVDK
jgi:hypothetical protein